MRQIPDLTTTSRRVLHASLPLVWGHINAAEYNAGKGTVGLLGWQELIGHLCAGLGLLDSDPLACGESSVQGIFYAARARSRNS